MIQSVTRAIAILECVAASGSNASLGQISSELELNKSTVHGIAATLEHLGYLTRHPETGYYALGVKTWELGQHYVSNVDILSEAKVDMNRLVRKYQDTALLAVVSDTEILYINKIDASRTLGPRFRIGGRAPMYCTGAGKAILAALPQSQMEKIISSIELVSYTEKTITDRDALLLEMQTIRKRGFSMDRGEFESELRSVGAPIYDHRGKVVASVSLAGSDQRFSGDRLFDITADVRETARLISERLGYKTPEV